MAKIKKTKAAADDTAKCLYCGKPLTAAKGKRQKKFCNDVCRSSFHQKNQRGTFNVSGGANTASNTETNTQHMTPYLLSRQKTKAMGKK
jgi:hypothetical protein